MLKKQLSYLGLMLMGFMIMTTTAIGATVKPKVTQTQSAIKVKTTNVKTAGTVNGYKLITKTQTKVKNKIQTKTDTKILVPTKLVVETFGGKLDSTKGSTNTISYYNSKIQLPVTKLINKSSYTDVTLVASKLKLKYNATSLTLTRELSNAINEFIIPSWTSGKHNKDNWSDNIKNYKPFESDTCINCHNGNGYGENKIQKADVDLTKDPSIGCSTCHYSARGSEALKGNTGKVAAGYELNNIGTPAICVTCHNGRALPNAETKAAPHPSNESEVVFAVGGYEYEGVAYPETVHGRNAKACVACHMAPGKDGVRSHSLKVNVTTSCAVCHKGLTTVNRTAMGDYDGDKAIKGIQDEVKGLIQVIKAELQQQGVTAVNQYGKFVITKGGAANDEAKYYYAAWNVNTIENEGSFGVHNPVYVVKLLQSTYKDLTGNDVPNATIKK